MDDDYIIKWVEYIYIGDGSIRWREQCESREILSDAISLFKQLKKKITTHYARISWGDTVIEEYFGGL